MIPTTKFIVGLHSMPLPVIEGFDYSDSSGLAQSQTVPLPAGTVEGDIVIAIFVSELANNNVNLSCDDVSFTKIGQAGTATAGVYVGAWWYRATATPPADVTMRQESAFNYSNQGWTLRVSGCVDTGDPVDDSIFDDSIAILSSYDIPSLTSTTFNSIGIAVLGSDGSSGRPFTVAAPWTKYQDDGNPFTPGPSGEASVISQQDIQHPSATGDCVVTPAVSAGAAWFNILLVSGDESKIAFIPMF